MERKCADTTGTVLVPMLKYNYIFQMKYPEAILQTALGNCSGLNLAKCWLLLKNKIIVLHNFRQTFVSYSHSLRSSLEMPPLIVVCTD